MQEKEASLVFGCSSAGRLLGEGRVVNGKRYTERPRVVTVILLSEETENGFSEITFRHQGRLWTATMDARYEASGGYHLSDEDQRLD